MNTGKTPFAQLIEFLPWTTFARIVAHSDGDHAIRTRSCAQQFRVMVFAQLTYRESLQPRQQAGQRHATSALMKTDPLSLIKVVPADAQLFVSGGTGMGGTPRPSPAFFEPRRAQRRSRDWAAKQTKRSYPQTAATPYGEHGEDSEHQTLTDASAARRLSLASNSKPSARTWWRFVRPAFLYHQVS